MRRLEGGSSKSPAFLLFIGQGSPLPTAGRARVTLAPAQMDSTWRPARHQMQSSLTPASRHTRNKPHRPLARTGSGTCPVARSVRRAASIARARASPRRNAPRPDGCLNIHLAFGTSAFSGTLIGDIAAPGMRRPLVELRSRLFPRFPALVDWEAWGKIRRFPGSLGTKRQH